MSSRSYREIRWRVESVVISWRQVNHNLVQLVLWMNLQAICKLRIARFSDCKSSLFPASEKALERIIDPFNLFDQPLFALSEMKDFSISRRNNRFRVHINRTDFRTNRAAEKAVHRRIKTHVRFDGFFHVDAESGTISAVDRISKKDGNRSIA